MVVRGIQVVQVLVGARAGAGSKAPAPPATAAKAKAQAATPSAAKAMAPEAPAAAEPAVKAPGGNPAARAANNDGVFGPGTLTKTEAAQLQALADKHGSQIDVVGSRASGKGRHINSKRKVGNKTHERSDIDIRYDGQKEVDTRGEFTNNMHGVGNGAGKPSFSTGPGGSKAPVIEFRPGSPPVHKK